MSVALRRDARRRPFVRPVLMAAVLAVVVVGLAPASGADPAVPTAPTLPLAAPGNGQAVVTWAAPASDGGSAITGYLVTPFIRFTALTARARTLGPSVRTATFTGLTNGTAYGFRIQALNSSGTGAAAMASAVVVGAPTAPPSVSASPGPRAATTVGGVIVQSLRPVDNGSTITTFTAVCTSPNGGTTRSASIVAPPGQPSIEVLSLTTGKTYRCSMTGTNARGQGPAGYAPALIVGAPRAPRELFPSVPAPGSIKLTFTAPMPNGDPPITVYTAACTSSNGGVKGSKLGGSPMTISGLTVGATYTCSVSGHNSYGNGVAAVAGPLTA